MSHLQSIVYKPESSVDPKDSFVRVVLNQAALIVGRGIEGDSKGHHPERQLNIMSAETMSTLSEAGFKTAPGQLSEQLVIKGVEVDNLALGTVLQIGADARVEVIKRRTGCARFESIQGKAKEEAQLGVMARVISGGAIQVEDSVTVVHLTPEQA